MPSAAWEMGKYKEGALADQRMLVTKHPGAMRKNTPTADNNNTNPPKRKHTGSGVYKQTRTNAQPMVKKYSTIRPLPNNIQLKSGRETNKYEHKYKQQWIGVWISHARPPKQTN